MSKGKLRVGLVGCGRVGAQTRPELRDRLGPNWLPLSHADAVKAIPDFALVACCDVDQEAASAAAAVHGIDLVYSDYADMLGEAELDVLCVATRSDVRPEILCAAAGAGIRAVHCEKPLAQSVALAGKAARALDAAGISFSYGTLRAYMPIFRQAKEMISGGGLGELQAVTVKFGRTGLLWNHPHSINLLCMLCGSREIEFVQANLQSERALAGPKLIDSDPLVLSATIGFGSGVTGHIVDQGGLSVDIAGSEKVLSLVGDGMWRVESDLSVGLNSDPPAKWSFARDATEVSGRVHALVELRDAIQLGKKTTLSVLDAWQEHRILFALAQSDRQGGRRVRIDEVDPDLVITGRVHGRVA
jgi:predicted dehydrogenase